MPRWLRSGFLPASIALLVWAGAAVQLPAFVELPGSAIGIPACVRIDARPGARVDGDFMLTTVGQRDATPFGLLLAWVRDDQRVVGKRDLLGDTRRDQYLERQREVFIDATDRAVAVALEAAGLPVGVTGEGVDVVEIIDGTPADGVLRPGDVITAVDGVPVRTDAELVDAIDGTAPLALRLRRGDDEVVERLAPAVRELDGEQRPVIGVRIVTRAPRLELPFEVEVPSSRVGGPSAGLMTALAIFDLVDGGDLAGGRRIAGTGTLALDGTVGTIGGIDLKVAAAARAGVDVFVAPAAQLSDARAAVPPDSPLVVVGAETFDAARSALAGGGDIATRDDARTARPTCRLAADA